MGKIPTSSAGVTPLLLFGRHGGDSLPYGGSHTHTHIVIDESYRKRKKSRVSSEYCIYPFIVLYLDTSTRQLADVVFNSTGQPHARFRIWEDSAKEEN